ncbi:hypothetical protein PFICI_13523 [Pestalotiopsis fici W106-1]|uniref:SMP-30/Gluconolactonase/LRE-like region domain-containing protein n=1 Tax=Pestalotiopsis fici (strain W106-1 / CGMCC3.15140) TaxID=1229662 RepID=W3WMP7_PESFW|nr:uncharacterized protein PFICI_13523 [Pestalotiopsis fici W106-1]ETS75039.1 hypothetical protein PFICI_13523 [Pestalotiopsis fici W106-1]
MPTQASVSPIAGTNGSVSSKTIHQFANLLDWAENIAVRPNGNLLVTLLGLKPQLWQIAEPWTDTPAATLVHTFPSELYGLVGIAETSPDVFVTAGINTTTPSLSSVWEVTFGTDDNDGSESVATRKIADMHNAIVLNGVAAVPGCGDEPSSSSAVLIADSMAGVVFRVDTQTGNVTTAAQVPEMAPLGNMTSTQNIGINGIKIRDGYLYFDNSYAATLYRVKIDETGFVAADAVAENVAVISDETFLDDFVFDTRGNIYIASNHGSTVRRVDMATGDNVVLAGAAGQQTVLGDTAAAFGRTDMDREVLYVTTSGFDVKTAVEPGKVVAINVAGLK